MKLQNGDAAVKTRSKQQFLLQRLSQIIGLTHEDMLHLIKNFLPTNASVSRVFERHCVVHLNRADEPICVHVDYTWCLSACRMRLLHFARTCVHKRARVPRCLHARIQSSTRTIPGAKKVLRRRPHSFGGGGCLGVSCTG